MTQLQPTRIKAATINAMQDEMAGAISPEKHFHDEWVKKRLTFEETNREIAASANRIDMIIGVFAIGVLFGTWIA